MRLINKILDNRFWYIGSSYSELGDNTICILVRNPWDDLRGSNDRARARQYSERQNSTK
jgi:hypothetical protein